MLYQQVRPKRLKDVVGNADAVSAVRRAIKSGKRAHAYLFHGASGAGKTTLARILMRALKCDPVVEVNAGTDGGIALARDQLRHYTVSAPLSGQPCGIILDEAALLTAQAQGALLKMLEDIPGYLFWALCTTDIQKLKETVRNRCEKIAVARLSDAEIEELIGRAVEKAHLESPAKPVIDAIVDAAKGCPREALVLLEKQVGLDGKEAVRVVSMPIESEETLIRLCRAVAAQEQWVEVSSILKKVLRSTPPEEVRRGLLGYFKTALLDGKTAKMCNRWAGMIEELSQDVYTSGEAGIVAMVYRAREP